MVMHETWSNTSWPSGTRFETLFLVLQGIQPSIKITIYLVFPSIKLVLGVIDTIY